MQLIFAVIYLCHTISITHLVKASTVTKAAENGGFLALFYNLRLIYDVSAPALGEKRVWFIAHQHQPLLYGQHGLYAVLHLQHQMGSTTPDRVPGAHQHPEITAFTVYLYEIWSLCQVVYGHGWHPHCALGVNLAGQAVVAPVVHRQLTAAVPECGLYGVTVINAVL